MNASLNQITTHTFISIKIAVCVLCRDQAQPESLWILIFSVRNQLARPCFISMKIAVCILCRDQAYPESLLILIFSVRNQLGRPCFISIKIAVCILCRDQAQPESLLHFEHNLLRRTIFKKMQKLGHQKMRIAFENHGFASARNATARLQLRNVSGGPPPPSLKYISGLGVCSPSKPPPPSPP